MKEGLVRLVPSSSAYSYDTVAWCYDGIAAFYSMGAIAAARASQVGHLEAGQRVLYAGVGSGEDALLAAQRGVRVTGLDLSPRMLRRLQHRLDRAGLEASLLCEDVAGHRPCHAYDAVAANFFLNVFEPSEMLRVMSHLVTMLRPGGLFLVADFARPGPSAVSRALRAAYYRPVNWAAWVLGLCALHPIYDYVGAFACTGLQLEARQRFRILGRGPALYESVVARRLEDAGTDSRPRIS